MPAVTCWHLYFSEQRLSVHLGASDDLILAAQPAWSSNSLWSLFGAAGIKRDVDLNCCWLIVRPSSNPAGDARSVSVSYSTAPLEVISY